MPSQQSVHPKSDSVHNLAVRFVRTPTVHRTWETIAGGRVDMAKLAVTYLGQIDISWADLQQIEILGLNAEQGFELERLLEKRVVCAQPPTLFDFFAQFLKTDQYPRLITCLGGTVVPRCQGWDPPSGWQLFHEEPAVRDLAQRLVKGEVDGVLAAAADGENIMEDLVIKRVGGGFDCIRFQDKIVQNLKSLMSWMARKNMDEIQTRLEPIGGWGVANLMLNSETLSKGEQVRRFRIWSDPIDGRNLTMSSIREAVDTIISRSRSSLETGASILYLALPNATTAAVMAENLAQRLGGPVEVRSPDIVLGWNPLLTAVDFIGAAKGPALFIGCDGPYSLTVVHLECETGP